MQRVILPSVIVRQEPDFSSETSSELIYGERVETLSENNGFYEIKNQADCYHGYVPIEAFSQDIIKPTHKISVLHSYLYAGPSFKAPPVGVIPFSAKVRAIGAPQDNYIMLENMGWIWANNLVSLDHIEPDFVDTALRFMGRPYLWGGKTAAGIDCSGLVQLCLQASGYHACTRDTKDQITQIGEEISSASDLQRGDLVYFKHHVGIMINETEILNATSRTMDVRIEQLSDLEKIYEGGILGIRRV